MTREALVGPLALLADALMRGALDPETARAFSELVPAAHRDQMLAASREQRRTLLQLVAASNGYFTERTMPATETPDWVRLPATTTLIAWTLGTAATCLHSPQTFRPEPVFAAAWRPNLITCGQCQHLFQLPPRSRADRTCDGCGRVCGGPPTDGIFTATIVIGELAYTFGACRDCRYWPQREATRK